jgi:hypothetical protein
VEWRQGHDESGVMRFWCSEREVAHQRQPSMAATIGREKLALGGWAGG